MKTRFLRLFLFLGLFHFVASQAQVNPDPFPRLGGYNIGSPHTYEKPEHQRELAKLNVVILNYWPGWEQGRGTTIGQVARNIKAINPQARVILYVVNNEADPTSVVFKDLTERLNQTKGWLYASRSSGAPLPSNFMPERMKAVNNTLFGPKDSQGKTFVEWYASWVNSKYYLPNKDIDGIYMDNVFWKPRVDGDWNLDGVKDSMQSADSGRWLRQGFARHFSVMSGLMPGKLQFANVADWGHPSAVITEYTGMASGGVMETFIGESYAPEAWQSFGDLLKYYRKTMAALKAPKLLLFNQVGSATDYQGFRYGFGICLLDDGYFNFTDRRKGYSGVPWFDEYDVKLGKATSAPPVSPWSKGVYRRDFEGGIVLVNPKGNGVVEVDVGTEFRKISGKQAPSVNNGGVAGRVRLLDRDAIVLVRAGTAKRPPRPPGNLLVQ